MKFTTTVELGGKTATGMEVPPDIVEALASGKKPAVRVTVGGHTYRSTVATMDGRFMLPLSAPNREAAGVQASDTVDVDIELDTEPREIEIPADFAAALDAAPEAKRTFEKLSYSNQSFHVLAIEGAKKPETRERRIRKSIETLAAGKPR